MQLPLIHLNGTSKQALLEQYQAPAQAVWGALRSLEQNGPNARDYYPLGPESFAVAQREHADRCSKLRAVHDELVALVEGIADGGHSE